MWFTIIGIGAALFGAFAWGYAWGCVRRGEHG
jgi:hypothetical protein